MVVGSITLLIPGAALTSGIRDMTGGDYISGTVRLLDALLGFISIAVGVGVTFAFCRSYIILLQFIFHACFYVSCEN